MSPSHPMRGMVMRCLLPLAILACGPAFSAQPRVLPEEQQGRTIYRDAILRSGATNGWEALRRTTPFLSFKESARGSVRATQRGPNSLLLNTELLLIVDGAIVGDFAYLKQIPAELIESIRILSGAEGTPEYGTAAGNGVVVVRTGPPLTYQ